MYGVDRQDPWLTLGLTVLGVFNLVVVEQTTGTEEGTPGSGHPKVLTLPRLTLEKWKFVDGKDPHTGSPYQFSREQDDHASEKRTGGLTPVSLPGPRVTGNPVPGECKTCIVIVLTSNYG